MSKHTPGPWFVDYGHNYDEIIGPKQEGIAQTGVWRVVEKEEQHANARLIAAAPDLLDALQRVMRHIPDNAGGASLSDDMHRAKKAIAKATGV